MGAGGGEGGAAGMGEAPGSGLPWVEKYRPATLRDVAAHTDIIDTGARPPRPSPLPPPPPLPSPLSSLPAPLASVPPVSARRLGSPACCLGA